MMHPSNTCQTFMKHPSNTMKQLLRLFGVKRLAILLNEGGLLALIMSEGMGKIGKCRNMAMNRMELFVFNELLFDTKLPHFCVGILFAFGVVDYISGLSCDQVLIIPSVKAKDKARYFMWVYFLDMQRKG